tara:strand:+ start:1472 stop:1942 length:471 start_codon:yes stop_codon:yes gene_type:complete
MSINRRRSSTRSIKINDIIYVSGDYFDEDEDNRWSEKVAKINYKKQSLLGLVKSFVRKYDEQYVNVLWFADFNEQAVLLKDVKRIPSNLKPITGVINNFNILLADYVMINKKCKIINLNNEKKNMTKDEIRLSGKKVVVINNYQNQNISEIYNSIS